MITVINYANGKPYEKFQRVSSFTAKHFGKADKVIEYSSTDIPQEYKDTHKEIFAYKRGAGLWLWKPYIICHTLDQMAEGEWLFYVDSGTVFIRSIYHLIECADLNNMDLMLFEQPLLERQFTKKECFDYMGITDYFTNQLLSGYILIRNNERTRLFMREWQHYCEIEGLISGTKKLTAGGNFPDFYSHREDQSILSLLRIKHGITVFRDPSDYGETPHMYFSNDYTYNPKKYPNSTYPTILLSNRRSAPLRYTARYFVKVLLRKFGLLKSESILKKRRIR